jgi:TetR/AcrR family transcriptional regulator, mexJK operon transcriptional repressor
MDAVDSLSPQPPAHDASDAAASNKRAQILRGAATVFAADGYGGASMGRIAQVAGVSKGTLYNYFDSKAALFSGYVVDECERKLPTIFAHAHHDGDPADTLHAIGRQMLMMMLSDTGLTIYRVVIAEAAKFPELAQNFFAAGPARAIDVMAGWLREETRRGRMHVADAPFAAEQFFNLCQTHLVLRRKLEMLPDPKLEQIDHVVSEATAMFLSQYGKKPSGHSIVGTPER